LGKAGLGKLLWQWEVAWTDQEGVLLVAGYCQTLG
jgi:hypothetical protein